MDETEKIRWVEPEDNPWGVRMLDVRAVTENLISTSADPQCAANAVSFGRDDGSAFAAEKPIVPRTIKAHLRYRVEGPLADGALFLPWEMEQKWAIFHRQGRILFVRSWTRKLHAAAVLEVHDDYVEITEIEGAFTSADEDPAFTARVVDFLLRTHALRFVYPAPLPPGIEESPQDAALWCFQMFGNRAHCATQAIIPVRMPEQMLKVLP
jgi:hypothetical protein